MKIIISDEAKAYLEKKKVKEVSVEVKVTCG